MQTRDGMVYLVHQRSGRRYLIHIQTGEMVDILKRLDSSKASFIRTDISKEDIENIKQEMGIRINDIHKSLSAKQELLVLKRMAFSYKKYFCLGKIQKVTFVYEYDTIVV